MMDECEELIVEISPRSENECKSCESNNLNNDTTNDKEKCQCIVANDVLTHTQNVNNDKIDDTNKTNIININDNKNDICKDHDIEVHHNNNERVNEMESLILQQRKKIDDYEAKIQDIEQKCQCYSSTCSDLEGRLQLAIRQCEMATKEKESMVMRYAVSEKGVIEQRTAREQAERKFTESVKEKDLIQQRLSTMVSEKARICQMLDNKCYELKTAQQELDRAKTDISSLETKLKWSQNSLRTEMELHKESVNKVDNLNARLQEATNEIEKVKKDAQESIKNFHQSQENRAHVLDQQLKEQQAALILEKHEREEREQQVTTLKNELDRLQSKHQALIVENNSLSLKVQQLEQERLENEQKLSELRSCADQLKQDETTLTSLNAAVERLQLQLTHEQEQRAAGNQQVDILRQRNCELEADMEVCRAREAEMLVFTQQLTDKNVRLQSEFSALETRVQQLTCEQTLLKRNCREQDARATLLANQLSDEQNLRADECKVLARHLAEKTKACEQLTQQLEDQRGENQVIRRKLDLSARAAAKELQQCHKKLEHYEHAAGDSRSRSSSSTSLSTMQPDSEPPHLLPAEPDPAQALTLTESADTTLLDKQTLINHIVKLQRASAKKSEKLDFLEEHVQTLVAELQRKSRLLQTYMLREQTGALTSNRMDEHKAELAKQRNGSVMASVFGSRVQDTGLTLELSLDINRKLQAVLEDTLLKNITLKENVDTLGAEIERLNTLISSH